MNKNRLILPCIKGRIGQWFYYSSIMSFAELADRVKLPREIDKKYSNKDLKLGEWIQRELDPKRTNRLVKYLQEQDERFFNSLVLGIFDGKPSWQDVEISKGKNDYEEIDEETSEYLSSTIGILTLDGSESLFAIDGQHRFVGIREAIKTDTSLLTDEVPVIFVAHKTDEVGKIRTRRLFSTLNRYAKPVNKSEIIALSEDDNCAIMTRKIIDNFELLKGKIIINKSPSISPKNGTDFTNIRTLYDIIERLSTDKKVYNFKVGGYNHYDFTNKRILDSEIESVIKTIQKTIKESLLNIPSFENYLKTGLVNRNDESASLLFRPIGQNILFDIIKVSKEFNKYQTALKFFSKDTFNLSNHTWKNILWDKESSNITTQKTRVKYATLLIIEHLGIPVNKTKKDLEMYNNFKIDPSSI